ncbi:MAG TPA: spermidine/putrescine ABC transporter substrate-binding protein [Anaerolineales bacterium]|nr:spermidine/putrescine ABC transporter substrate-binding protein [Anaerolineales bacterium]
MNKFHALLLAVGLALLTACASGGTAEPSGATQPAAATQPPAAPTEAMASVSDRCGDPSKLSQELYLYTWVEYIDPDIKDQFETECGVKVVEDDFDSNETLLAKLQAGGANYDVIVPSDYMVQIMIDEGILEPLDFSIITNIGNYGEGFTHQYFDLEQKYTVPYFFGTSGFAVDTNVIPDPVDSWTMMFKPSPEVCGKMSMLDDERETFGAALMYLGYSINDTDPVHLDEAKDLLIEQSKCVLTYDSQTNDDILIQGETVIGHMWTGDAILAGLPDYGGREGIVYVIPQEGCTIWQDNLAVPVGAVNKYTAMIFINYLSDPEIAAQNAEYVGYGSPNQAAYDFIDPDVLADEGIYPTAETFQRLQWIEDVGDSLELYDLKWTEFKAAIGQ